MREKGNSHHVGVQDSSFCGDLHKVKCFCVESDKIPLLRKLYKCLPVGFLIDIAYTANRSNDIPYKLSHQDGEYISSIIT